MEFTFKNHNVIIREKNGNYFLITIQFGDMELREEVQANNIKSAKALAKQLINELCAELPPALSYKYYNDGN